MCFHAGVQRAGSLTSSTRTTKLDARSAVAETSGAPGLYLSPEVLLTLKDPADPEGRTTTR